MSASGYTAEAITNHGALEPGTAFLTKPSTFAALAQRVGEVLDSEPDRRDPTAGLNREADVMAWIFYILVCQIHRLMGTGETTTLPVRILHAQIS